jgi:uncharacterized protein
LAKQEQMSQQSSSSAAMLDETLSLETLAHVLSAELQLNAGQIARTIALLDTGNTIPFIARYRKEVTGSLDEVQIQAIADRAAAVRALHERKLDVRRLIAEQGKLTPELEQQLEAAATLQEVEDLYLPYRPKRKTRASVAREKGLAPLAELILQQPELSGDHETLLEEHARPYLNAEKGVDTSLEAYEGAKDIVAEVLAEDANVRGSVRAVFFKQSTVSARVADEEKLKEKDPNGVYQLYYEFNEDISKLVPHRVLALNRAEREEVLRVSVTVPYEQVQAQITQYYPIKPTSPFAYLLSEAMEDGYKRLLAPAMEREVRVELTRRAEEHAIQIFATNLRNLLLQPPLRGKKVLGIDPGYRTGCKLAVVDENGKYLESDTMYLHQAERARQQLLTLLNKYRIDVIAIGNGTASRETEQLVADLIREIERQDGWRQVGYVMVNEAGASVYSASEVARQEFPTLDATQRGTISIARRLQDPLAELVKIDPKAVGVGLYQHDVDQKELAAMLDRVVVSCVNFAGVEVNSASAALLKHVSGINSRVANAIVKYREEHGPFKTRQELLNVPGLGPATFVQAAGFLKIANGVEPLDNTFIHPESYQATRALLALLPGGNEQHLKPAERIAQYRQLIKLQSSLGRSSNNRRKGGVQTDGEEASWAELAAKIGVGLPTLHDILENLEKPGLDPRDALPAPILRHDVLKMEDLQAGMILQGTVRNVVDFGAFVDIGIKQDGLVHVSEMADRFVKDPLSVVAVGQIVRVRVLKVDMQRGRVQLSMRGVD